jgi:hypothetical protein
MFYSKKLDFIMRYFLILAACLSLSTQSIHSVMMNGEGIQTASGFVKWASLVSLSRQVRILQATCVVLAAAIVYMRYFDNKNESTTN